MFFYSLTRAQRNNHMFNVHDYDLSCVFRSIDTSVYKCVFDNEIKSLYNCFFTTQLPQPLPLKGEHILPMENITSEVQYISSV